MTVYLASPGSQMHADHLKEMPVLVSYGAWAPWMESYQHSFDRVLVDSGAFSVLNSGKRIDVGEYAEWAENWRERADAIACLDDIAGDWKQGMKNMEAMPDGIGFPTYHDTDPIEILPDLCDAACERGGWLGIGLTPSQRHNRAVWLQSVLNQIPDGLHVHGWACRYYWRTHARLDSVDSTNWMMDELKIMEVAPWLTRAERIEIVVKRYKRERRLLKSQQGVLF